MPALDAEAPKAASHNTIEALPKASHGDDVIMVDANSPLVASHRATTLRRHRSSPTIATTSPWWMPRHSTMINDTSLDGCSGSNAPSPMHLLLHLWHRSCSSGVKGEPLAIPPLSASSLNQYGRNPYRFRLSVACP